MTNEQTYLLLMWIAEFLKHEINDFRMQLPESLERHSVTTADFSEAVIGGDFLILDGLKGLLQELNIQAKTFLGTRSVTPTARLGKGSVK